MEESELPREFIAAWNGNTRYVGGSQTTICHTYLHALHMVCAIDLEDKQGSLEKCFLQLIEDPKYGTFAKEN
eukprot:3289030-Ditylum_brightwellii.AAC.1